MGNTPSKHPIPGAAAAAHKPTVKNAPAQVPPVGRNHQRFEIISPASDLSNPSNLARLKSHTKTQTPVRERRRTSKVMTRNGTGRLVTNQRTTLPPPGRFVFPAGVGDAALPSTIREDADIANAKPHEQKQLETLATRAKNALKSCLGNDAHRDHHQLASIPPSIQVHHMEPVSEMRKPLVRESQDNYSRDTSEQPNVYAQFDPTRPSRAVQMENPYLHSEDNYFKSLSSNHREAPQLSPQQKATHEHRDEEEEAPTSPVVQLFEDDDDGIMNDLFPTRQEAEQLLSTQKQQRQKEWLDCVLGVQEESRTAYMEAKQAHKASHILPSESSATAATASTLDRDTVTSENKTVESASLEPRMSAEEMRLSIEFDMQRQIDQQLAVQRGRSATSRRGRIEELRSQYQKELDRISSGQKNAAAGTNDYELLSGGSTVTSTVQEKRELFERKVHRSNSLPITQRKSVEDTKAVAAQVGNNGPRKRSSSVPPREQEVRKIHPPKTQLPALLHLAGWQPSAVTVPLVKKEKAPVVVVSKEEKLPALLKLTGWTENNEQSKRRKSRLSIQSALPRLQRNKRLTMTFNNSVNRKSDPIPSSKPMPGASKSRQQAQPVPKARKVSSESAVVVEKSNVAESPDTADAYFPVATMMEAPAKNSFGITTASMLQQTYSIAVAETTNGAHIKASLSHMEKMRSMQLTSPAYSLCSLDTQLTTDGRSPKPMVSEQAENNASFLFSDAEDATKNPSKHNDNDSIKISTVESLTRLPGASIRSHAVTGPASKASTVCESSLESKDRRVRFSDLDPSSDKSPFRQKQIHKVGSVSFHPAIESRVSDLTDTESVLRPTASRDSDLPQIEAIPEEPTSSSQDSCPFLDDDSDEENDQKNESPIKDADIIADIATEPSMHWSYYNHSDSGLGVGVTPLRKGSSTSYATNSPFLRFKDARSKFATPVLTKKVSPVKKPSPVKQAVGGGLVSARVTAIMEAHTHSSTTKPIHNNIRRATSGYKVLAPHKTSLVSPFLRRNSSTMNSEPSDDVSPMLVNDQVVDSESRFHVNSPTGSDSTQDPFGRITHSKTFDEGSDDEMVAPDENVDAYHQAADCEEEASDDDNDAFAELLNDSDDDNSTAIATVSTIQNDSTGYAAALRRFQSNGPYQAPNDMHSAQSSGASQVAESVSTMSQKRLSFASSTVSSSHSTSFVKPMANLGFRDAALVRPTEQRDHRATPGTLLLSPMQRTPMQARKWRTLAAAAQEKDQKTKMGGVARRNSSLKERNPNVHA